MKKICIALAAVLTVSCSDFLSRPPQNSFYDSSYYQTADECINGVTYVYNALWTQDFHTGKFIIGNIVADDATKGGENDAEWGEINAAIEFRPTPSEDVADVMWEPCYRGITRANYMIDILSGKNFNTESPSGYPIVPRLIGECKFIRAFFSYYLVTLYGEVPYFTRQTMNNITDDLYDSHDRDFIWAQIESDLDYAMKNLPSRKEYIQEDWGRITGEAAAAMLGKVYLFRHKYDDAARVLEPLVKSPDYHLLPDYGQVFEKTNEFSAESVFEIPFGGTQFAYTSQKDGALGTGVLQFQARRNGDDGWGFNNPTDDLVNEYEEGDPRLIYTVIFEHDEFEKGVQQTSDIPKYKHFNRKAYLTKEERLPDYGNVDYHLRIIRLSDVYLMYAEALTLGTEKKNTTEALYYLNEVRKRANTTPKKDPKRVVQQITIADIQLPMREFTDDEQLLMDIKHERRVELGMEDHRWWDLLRWGETGKMAEYYKKWGEGKKAPNGSDDLKGKYYSDWIAKFPSGVYPVFPIPQEKIDGSAGKIRQTEYYR